MTLNLGLLTLTLGLPTLTLGLPTLTLGFQTLTLGSKTLTMELKTLKLGFWGNLIFRMVSHHPKDGNGISSILYVDNYTLDHSSSNSSRSILKETNSSSSTG